MIRFRFTKAILYLTCGQISIGEQVWNGVVMVVVVMVYLFTIELNPYVNIVRQTCRLFEVRFRYIIASTLASTVDVLYINSKCVTLN